MYKVKCTFCNDEVEREYNVKSATCFNCKTIQANNRGLKFYYTTKGNYRKFLNKIKLIKQKKV